MTYRELAGAAIFVAALAAVIARPSRLDESITAALGAVAMLAFGVLDPEQALTALTSQWNLFLFFFGLMLISGLADAAGFFDAAGALAAAAARGSGHLGAGLRLPFMLGTLTGADLGPNLTPVGSLSTMLWLVIVRRQGVEVSAFQYLKLGAIITPLLLLTAAVVVAGTFQR